MTAMPEKFSCAKSERSEKACWRSSQRRVITRLISVPMMNIMRAGMRASIVSRTSIRHILYRANRPSVSASKNISTPSPKHSWMVSRSLVYRLIRLPTLFT